MNHGIYRLVFNEERKAWMAVAEFVCGRGKKSHTRRLGRLRRQLAAAAALGLAASGMPALAAPPAPTQLPMPSSGARPFVASGAVAGGAPSTSGNTMTIQQQSQNLSLNWKSFDIGKDAAVRFNQPNVNARVLNRIWDNNPSQIFGQLSANGQVYLVNQNGVIFGNGAQVNVGGLIASAHKLSEEAMNRLMERGLPTARGEKLEFAYDGALADFAKGAVIVEAGATITTPSGGRVLLIAPKTVQNEGFINGGGGAEAILAAGGKVILTAPDDPNLRGLLVETKAFSGKDSLGNTVTLDGTVSNRGTINEDAANGKNSVATLAALAVNQQGVVNASKAVNINGKTMLVATQQMSTDRLTIHQRENVAEADWVDGLDLGKDKNVKALEVVQASAGDALYNYVHVLDDGRASSASTAGRSMIDGELTANGQFLLVNQKGIDFGQNARVKASNFVASGLNIDSDVPETGLLMLSDEKKPAFFLRDSKKQIMTDSADSQAARKALAEFREATVHVAPGATIESSENGYVVLAGSKVSQAGTITTPRGQTVLAAGAEVFLTPPYGQALRGFSAEVNPLYAVKSDSGNPWLPLSRGADANAVTNTGSIRALLGNITLVGHEITQAGRLESSTSVTDNGSIRLLARDMIAESGLTSAANWSPGVVRKIDLATGEVSPFGAADPKKFEERKMLVGRTGGKLVLAPSSVTQVTLDGSGGRKTSSGQPFMPSSIEAAARKIEIDGTIAARGGRVAFRAQEVFDASQSAFVGDPVSPEKGRATPPADVGIYLSDQARIDASGAVAQKSVSDLFIPVELRGDEFADNPVQRHGELRGKTAYVDIRDKVSIADLSGHLKQVGQTVEEKAATAGSIALESTGSVILKSGALLDVSGGLVDYAAGTVSESLAYTRGGRFDRLNDASAFLPYAGLLTVSRQEAAYREGRSAGTVKLTGHSLAIDGNLQARTTPGQRQRTVGGDPVSNRQALPLGGRLILSDAGQHFAPEDNSEAARMAAFTTAQMVFVRDAAKSATSLSANSLAGPRTEISSRLVDTGFSRFEITSDGRIELPADVALRLPAGGSFSASGRQLQIAGDISAPGGKITLATRDMSRAGAGFPSPTEAKYSNLVVEGGAELSTAGVWVNDRLDGPLSAAPKAIHGGEIVLNSAYDLDLAPGSVLDVSGGALLDGKLKLTAGNAGAIRLKTGQYGQSGQPEFSSSALFAEGQLRAYAPGNGGTLEITSPLVRVGDQFAPPVRETSAQERLNQERRGAVLTSSSFSSGGFREFRLNSLSSLLVEDGMVVRPNPLSLDLTNSPGQIFWTSGSRLTDLAPLKLWRPELRSAPTALALSATSDLTVGKGTRLAVDPQGKIDLTVKSGQLSVFGTLEAPGGQITLSRTGRNLDYDENQQSRSIYLGESSRLLAGGTTKLSAATVRALEAGLSPAMLQRYGRYLGEVLDGGVVDIRAGLGYLIARQGSFIDVGGATGTLNVESGAASPYANPLRDIGSAGGQVRLAAREGMFVDAAYNAKGGKGAPGGVFSLRLVDDVAGTGWETLGLPTEMTAARQLTLFAPAAGNAENQWVASGINTENYLDKKDPIKAKDFNGQARFDTARLASGGFGSAYLASEGSIRFDGKLDIALDHQLRLDAPTFSAKSDATDLRLTAAAVQIGNFSRAVAAPDTPAVGNGRAHVNALDIGLVGAFAWSGFGHSQFVSGGEIHFDGVTNTVTNRTDGRQINGQMKGAGAVEFAASRLSPATWSDFTVDFLSDPASRIEITRTGTPTAPLLSGGGLIEFAANTINHRGRVEAPQGEIRFSAPASGGKVTLEDGSVSTVQAEMPVLLGMTEKSGREWNYETRSWNKGSLVESNPTAMAAPARQIRIDAGESIVSPGARVDLSAGGEAFSWEFSPGPGGKKDVLAPAAGENPMVFAILPGWNGRYNEALDHGAAAPYKVSQGQGGETLPLPALRTGDRIALDDLPGALAGGQYTLLPARYALLPGAWLLTLKPSAPLSVATRSLDGSWQVGASLLAAKADGSHVAYGQKGLMVELASPAVLAERASYTLTGASNFFRNTPGAQTAKDAGRLSLVGRESLAFDPAAIIARHVGRGLELDLAAMKMWVADSGSVPDASWSLIDQAKLGQLGLSSLLLGGARTMSGGETEIETIAKEVRVENQGAANPASALVAPEIMLSARDTLQVATGSRIEAAGVSVERQIRLKGDGAFLRSAGGAQASLQRASAGSGSGNFELENGAEVAGHALIFDATGDNRLKGRIALGSLQADDTRQGGYLHIGAKRINFVADEIPPAEGLSFDNEALQGFLTADQLYLSSYGSFNLYGNAALGSQNLKELVLASGGISGHGLAENAATISAKRLVLENPNRVTADAATGQGQLMLSAETLEIASNTDAAGRKNETTGLALGGFGETLLEAQSELRFVGTGVTDIKSDKTEIQAGRVVTVDTADHLLKNTGSLAIKAHQAPLAANSNNGLGGQLDLRAQSMAVSGVIEAAAGRIRLVGEDAVTLEAGARIAAEGRKLAFHDTWAYAPGGAITLESAKDNINVGAGAVLSVSAHADGGDAGSLALIAKQGKVTAAANTLHGAANPQAESAGLTVDAKTLGLDNLADALVGGSFGESLELRAREANLTLSQGKTLKAKNISIAADKGGITVAGAIDASGAKGGEIALYANNGDVKLEGKLLAKGQEFIENANNAGTRGRGGKVLLAASGTKDSNAAKVITGEASEIDVGVAERTSATGGKETSQARGGKVVFRAAESTSIAAASDLNIELKGKVSGASDVGAEIVSRFEGKTSLTTGGGSGAAFGIDALKNALETKYSAENMTTLRTHLFGADHADKTDLHVRPGAEIIAAGDFTIAKDLDFAPLRFQGEAGVLTIRAQGDLKVNNSISDGFGKAGTNASTSRDGTLSSSDTSWSYRLVAGADTAAAKLTAFSEGVSSKGNITIAGDKLVRTGTGDISLAAKRSISLGNKAAVYTAGYSDAANPANFSTPASAAKAYYPMNGGDLGIVAGGDITQAASIPGAVSDWLVTYSTTYDNTQWWPRIASFQHGFAAFGGGDVRMAAGGDIKKVAAVIPTVGRVPGVIVDGKGQSQAERALINGGGDLSVRVAGTIEGGLFYAETGKMKLVAGKDIVSDPVIASGNTQVELRAAGSLALGNITNPMATSRSAGPKNSSAPLGPLTREEYRMRIGTYGADSQLNLLALSGDLAINTDGNPDNGIAPARVSATALNGSMTVKLLQMPGADGQLDLLAAKDIVVTGITQYDTPENKLPSIGSPVKFGKESDPFPDPTPRLPGSAGEPTSASKLHSSTPWHANDPEPSRIVALNGNISGSSVDAKAWFAEAATVKASGDISSLSVMTQHAKPEDVSQVIAGGQVKMPAASDGNAMYMTFQVGGPGRLEMLAGKGVDLGSAKGVISRGNLDNPFLPEGGADIFVLAGSTRADYDGFRNYLAANGLPGGNESSEAVLRDHFFALLRDAGRVAIESGDKTHYEQGRAASAALFPNGTLTPADIDLFYSTIKTEQGGKIDLLAPGGGVTVGILRPDEKMMKNKTAAEQGLFTIRDGAIRAFVEDSFLVNQSRVFTLDGGDILVWSDRGIIDAGKGAKTANSTPPPRLVIRNGQIVLDTSNSVSGSGIGVLASRDTVKPSDMDLFAPEGLIDAGDAGLRSTGRINLGAQTILNSNNIQAAAGVSGAPSSVAAAAPVATVTSPKDNNLNKTVEDMPTNAGKREETLGVLTVEVLDNATALPDDSSSEDDEEEKRKKKRKST